VGGIFSGELKKRTVGYPGHENTIQAPAATQTAPAMRATHRPHGVSFSRSTSLLIVGALIDVGGHRPVSVCHDARCVEDNQGIELIEHDIAIAATVDVEDQRHVAKALGRSRGQRGGR
jgi:hypothetical protein